jgi:hypothetical protein
MLTEHEIELRVRYQETDPVLCLPLPLSIPQ